MCPLDAGCLTHDHRCLAFTPGRYRENSTNLQNRLEQRLQPIPGIGSANAFLLIEKIERITLTLYQCHVHIMGKYTIIYKFYLTTCL
jgi:hypothetical protein